VQPDSISKVLRDHHLALGADAVNHTDQV
jgi:hypothetical protein